MVRSEEGVRAIFGPASLGHDGITLPENSPDPALEKLN